MSALDNRYLPPLLITAILLTAHFSFGILEGPERTALAIATAIVAELVLGRITYGVWLHPASAYITGISVGILVRSPFLWPYFLCSLHLDPVEVRAAESAARHLWNPSNFGRQPGAVPGARDGLAAERAVGQRRGADGGHLGAGLGDRLPRRPLPHLSATYVASFLAVLVRPRRW